MLRIVCVKAGTKYGPEYVNILADMCRRNLPEGFPGQVVCFTDDAIGLDASIAVRPLPGGLEGWWNKLYLFKNGLFEDGDRILFLDLDTVIVGALDQIVAYDGPFAILRDFYRPNGLQSSVMAWPSNTLGFLWDEFEADGFPNIIGGDQAWIEFAREKLNPQIWQELFPKTFVSFKVDCQPMPPRGAKVVVFHGEPRPHNCGVDWVKAIWAINGGQGFDLEQICNTTDDHIVQNVRSACARDLPWLETCKAHDKQAIIVGGGPSLRGQVEDIRRRQADGAVIFSTNNTAQFLTDHSVSANYHIILDARQENAKFITGDDRAGRTHLISSQCDPEVFDRLASDDVIVWHPYTPVVLQEIIDDPRPVEMVGCGSTVCLKAIGIAHGLGFRTFHLYGMDSCFMDGAHHAYVQPQNDADRILDVQVGERLFKAAPWMVAQVNEFQDLAAHLANEGCTITVSGDGTLIHAVAVAMMGDGMLSAADQRARAILSNLPDGPIIGAEIGVFAGELSMRLLQRANLSLYMVDSWKGAGADYTGDSGDWHAGLTQAQQDAYMARSIAVVGFAGDRAKIMAIASHKAAALIEDVSLDFVFIDADHSYEGCAADIAAWLPKLKPAGILSGHDYENTDFPKFGVTRAVNEFCQMHGCELRLGDNFTWFISNTGLRKAA